MASVRSRPLLVALVAVLAIALAAATLNTAVTPDGVGLGERGGFGGGTGVGQGSGTDDDGQPSSFGFGGFAGGLPVIPLPCFPVLNEPWFLLGFALVAGTGLYLLARWKGPLVPIGVAAGVGPPLLLVHALLTACRTADAARFSLPFANRSNTSAAFSLSGGPGGGGAAAGGSPVLTHALFGVLGLVLLVAVALLFQATGDDAPSPPAAVDDPDPVRVAAIGRAAGRAADRIEGDADPDNAVYRAWKEMTDLLDVANPRASTPAEFAAAAVEAGLDADDVAELTALFETVRYGTAEPTADREARAVAALRRIEATYAGEGS